MAEGKATQSHADRLMADLRSKISAIASEADRSTEDCVAFFRKEAAYSEWRKRHIANGVILHRDAATAKTAYLHVATCPVIGGDDDDGPYTQSPKVGCPTKDAAMNFARAKKWKVLATCDQCPQ